jgi:uncharacterized protein
MSGTKIGGAKAAKTTKEKYGDSFYCTIGSKGGKACVPKGFAISGLASSAGKKGGATSKRGKSGFNNISDSNSISVDSSTGR